MMIYLICAIYIFLPLAFVVSLGGIDANIMRLIPLALGFLWISDTIASRRSIKFFLTPIAIASLIFILWLIISVSYSAVPLWSVRKLAYFLTFLPLVVVMVDVLVRRDDPIVEKMLVNSVVVGGLIAAVVALIQFSAQFVIGLKAIENLWVSIMPLFLGVEFAESVRSFNSWFVSLLGRDVFRAIGFFPDPHVFAFYTGAVLPFAGYLYAQTQRRRWLLIFVIILTANLLTFSRGGEVGLLVGGASALLLFWSHVSRNTKLALVAMSAVLVIFVSIPSNPISQRFLSSFSSEDNSNNSRIEIWKEAISILSEAPLIGAGIGAYVEAVDPLASYDTPIYAHNLFLDILVEVGLVGFFIVLFIIARSILIFWRTPSNLGRCAIISWSILLGHGIFDTPIFSIHTFSIICFLIVLAIVYERKQTEIFTK